MLSSVSKFRISSDDFCAVSSLSEKGVLPFFLLPFFVSFPSFTSLTSLTSFVPSFPSLCSLCSLWDFLSFFFFLSSILFKMHYKKCFQKQLDFFLFFFF